MERFIKKDAVFVWSQECQRIFDTLKEKMDYAPRLVFPDWNKEFHVHVDASLIVLGVMLEQPGERDIDHLIVFARR